MATDTGDHDNVLDDTWHEDLESYLSDDDPFVAQGFVGDPLTDAEYELVYRIDRCPDERSALAVVGYRGAPVTVDVPEEWGGMPVARIAQGAFQDCETLVSISMTDTIDDIGERAFAGCANLRHVELPWSLYCICEGTFEGCVSLEKIELPHALVAIYDSAFCGCGALREIDLCVSVQTIGNSAFAWCDSLESVSGLGNVNEIGRDAFFGCASLRRLYIGQPDFYQPEWLEVGERAFSHCGALESVEIERDESLELGRRAFAECTSLRTVAIRGAISEVPEGAFEGCAALEHVEVSDRLESISWRAFAGCSSLQSFDLVWVNRDYDPEDVYRRPLIGPDGSDVEIDPTAFD